MKTLRYYIRLITAFIWRFKALIAAGTVLGLIVFFATGYLYPQFVGKPVENIGVTGRYHTENLPYSVLNLIGNGLTKLDETGDAMPSLSESWKSADKGKEKSKEKAK